ncbi:MAG: hypothetical protein ACPG06_08000 [Alphaproteobacteria bacterium]
MSKKILPLGTAIACAFLFVPTLSAAQSSGGQIKGTVTDEAGLHAIDARSSSEEAKREKGFTDEQIKTVTGDAPAPATKPDRKIQGEAEDDSAAGDATNDDSAIGETLSAKPPRKTQGEDED